ncbi:MAG TPA: ABC transporter permease [Acetobacteraceae bacterium]|jgi:putative spermidine/putrescine transport system permease protein|nr:ABC transporter permease [Acetobacteraceae bacterium]
MIRTRAFSTHLRGVGFVLPLLLVMLAAYVWPLWQTLLNALHPNTPQGIDTAHWTAANFAHLSDPLYLQVLTRTLRISVIVSAIAGLAAYPIALRLTRMTPRWQPWVILAFVSPFLINTVVKSFGWSLLLRANGLVNTALQALHITDMPLRLMLNETGVIIALVPGHFMFVLLPLWGAIAAIDPNLGWAAGTLGARRWQVFRHVVLPLTWPALVTGLVINFIMNMTAFAAPAILGGARTLVVSVLAYQVNLEQLNWPLGSAIAVALLAFTLALVGVGQRLAVRR